MPCDLALCTAAVTALKQNRGYYVAISSAEDQVSILSDVNISKHALNRLFEFIALGSFLFFN